MSKKKSSDTRYYQLAQNTPLQTFMFFFIILCAIVLIFSIELPVLQYFFEEFLNGRVFNAGESVAYTIDSIEPVKHTSYLFNWAVDIYLKTPEETRYWFNPALSLFLLSSIFGLGISFILTTLLPLPAGYMRQKIEREIANTFDKISVVRYGFQTENENAEMENEILNASLEELHEFAMEWGFSVEDLKALQRALKWRDANIIYKIIHINDGIRMYMRFYFTFKYSNAVLGFVYVGAAVLIIIIGLRGLKFVPPTQPSLVLFALGLEFVLLIVYAITLMYSKEEEDSDSEAYKNKSRHPENFLLSNEFGSAKEIEKLLRVFIKNKKK
jgi:hypothetical protein